MPKRNRGITYAEVLVATIFLGVCSASILEGLQSSTDSLKLAQRRQFVLNTMQGVMEEARVDIETTNSPMVGTSDQPFSLPSGGEVIITKKVTLVSGRNLATVALFAAWPERRASKDYTDSASLELTVKILEN